MLSFSDTVTLNNGRVRLGVSPAVGRVVDFGLSDGANLLWINRESVYDNPVAGQAVPGQQYLNLGGDKLWPTTQPLWKNATGNDQWPPDGVIDGGTWSLISQGEHEIVIESPPSPHYGITVRRSFRLDPEDPVVEISNVLRRTEANPIPLQAWTITQVQTPQKAMLDLASDAPVSGEPIQYLTGDTWAKVKDHVYLLGDSDSDAVAWTMAGDANAKLGTFGRWVAGVYPDLIFLQEADFNPTGAYPERSSAQVYRADSYTELELLSPLRQLAPGEELQFDVTWTLIPVASERADALLLERESSER
jgi:hypothetical protein